MYKYFIFTLLAARPYMGTRTGLRLKFCSAERKKEFLFFVFKKRKITHFLVSRHTRPLEESERWTKYYDSSHKSWATPSVNKFLCTYYHHSYREQIGTCVCLLLVWVSFASVKASDLATTWRSVSWCYVFRKLNLHHVAKLSTHATECIITRLHRNVSKWKLPEK